MTLVNTKLQRELKYCCLRSWRKLLQRQLLVCLLSLVVLELCCWQTFSALMDSLVQSIDRTLSAYNRSKLQSSLLTDIFISLLNTKSFKCILFNSLFFPASMIGSSRFHCSSVVKAKLSLFPPDFGAM